MLWSELLAELDEIRVYLRSQRKAKDKVQEGDEILMRITALAARAIVPALVQIVPTTQTTQPVTLTLPAEEEPPALPTPTIKYVEERGNGEGRMIVMGRDKPFVPRKPTLEEVFDEKELGK